MTTTRQLAALVELRRDLVDRRTQALLQLVALLKSYFPQAVELVGQNLTSSLALAFLRRWPDPLALKAARPGTLKSFYYQHSVRSEALVTQRLALVQQLRPLTTDEVVLEPRRACTWRRCSNSCAPWPSILTWSSKRATPFSASTARLICFGNCPVPAKPSSRGCSSPLARIVPCIRTRVASSGTPDWPPSSSAVVA